MQCTVRHSSTLGHGAMQHTVLLAIFFGKRGDVQVRFYHLHVEMKDEASEWASDWLGKSPTHSSLSNNFYQYLRLLILFETK